MPQYNPTQEQQAIALMAGVSDYLTQLINYNASNYKTGILLAQDPELMSDLVDYYRVQDMCFTYLVDSSERYLPHKLEDLDSDQIDQFLSKKDPQDVFNFFNQENIIQDFTLANEFSQKDAFNKDPKFKSQYQQFIQ